jgi:hypothetical protein
MFVVATLVEVATQSTVAGLSMLARLLVHDRFQVVVSPWGPSIAGGGEELVDLRVRLRYLGCVRRSPHLASFLYICTGRRCLYQRHLFLFGQVLQLDGQQCKLCDRHVAVTLAPL